MISTPSTLLFVDPTVADYESLLEGLNPNTRVILLDAGLDGIDQITQTLAGYSNLQSIQILSHGQSGALQLGSGSVTTSTLLRSREAIQSWGRALTTDGDILLLGCDVAAGDTGTTFINTLADLTAADIAASTNLTGSAALGGDWLLEAVTGQIEAPLAFQQQALDAYQSVLRSVLLLSESFAGDTVTPGSRWLFGTLGSTTDQPYLTARSTPTAPPNGLPGAPVGTIPDAVGTGALRLTSAVDNRSAFVIYNQALPSSAGLDVTFDFYSYGGDGADGIAFFLIDGNANPTTAGADGGSLGYATRISLPPNDVRGNGLEGGYLGIGFDEFGNFANQYDLNNAGGPIVRNGGLTSRAPQSVTLRGPGSGRTGYNYITHTPLGAGLTIDAGPNATRDEARRTARILLTPTGSLTISVDPDGRNRPLAPITLITINNIATATGSPIPSTFKFGFAASTGNQNNIHEINTLEIRTASFPPVANDIQVIVNPGTTSVAFTGANALSATDPEGEAITGYIITQLPTVGVLRRGSGAAITALPLGGLRLLPAAAALLTYEPPTGGFTGAQFEYTAVDASGAIDPTPAIVSLVVPPNNLPVARSFSFLSGPGQTTPVPALEATDQGGTIVRYTITVVPDQTQGRLELRDPVAGSRILQAGDRLSPDQVDDLVFVAAPGFTTATFQFTATDNQGAFSTPATVSIGIDTTICPPGITVLANNAVGQTITGTVGTDTLTGIQGNDTIFGGNCGDLIDGGAGDDVLLGQSGRDTITGGIGADTIFGGSFFDLLNGGDGNDVINGGLGGDIIDGGAGSDFLRGQVGDDLIRGGDDNDEIEGRDGNDRLEGGLGDDRLSGGFGVDTMLGGQGNDTLFGFNENDLMFGGVGDDELSGEQGADQLDGGDGNDLMDGGLDNDSLAGGIGTDTLFGGEGDDTLNGDAGNDELSGEAGRDLLLGGDGDDTLRGGPGDDRLDGNAGNDVLGAGFGNDFVRGGIGDDTLRGSAGVDTLRGGEGNDAIFAGSENDDLSGGAGNDSLFGGYGADILTGDTGADVFGYGVLGLFDLVFRSSALSLDRITDFRFEEGDRLRIQLDDGNATPVLPTALTNAGIVTATGLIEAATVAFNDANQTAAGPQALAVGAAAFFTWQNGVFLGINATGAGFQADADFLVDVTGISFRAGDATAGVLSVTDYFLGAVG